MPLIILLFKNFPLNLKLQTPDLGFFTKSGNTDVVIRIRLIRNLDDLQIS